MTGKEFWIGVFSEPGGGPSFSRVATGVLVAFAAGWVTSVVLHNHALPDFGGLAIFIGTLYGVNRVPGVLEAWKGSTNSSAQKHPESGNRSGAPGAQDLKNSP